MLLLNRKLYKYVVCVGCLMVDDVLVRFDVDADDNRQIFICRYCNHAFKYLDDLVCVKTINVQDIVSDESCVDYVEGFLKEEEFFHLDCWKKWFEESMNQCAININENAEKYLEFKKKNTFKGMLSGLGDFWKNGKGKL